MSAIAPAAWRFGIAPRVLEKLEKVFFATPGLRAVWIFGSRARGDQRPESDIDLAVDLPEPACVTLRGAIEDLELIYPVQVVNLQSELANEFRRRIMRDKRLVWSAEDTAGPPSR